MDPDGTKHKTTCCHKKIKDGLILVLILSLQQSAYDRFDELSLYLEFS